MLLLKPLARSSRSVVAATLLHVWLLILTFISPIGFYTRRLAYVVDSLVRVSRRVNNNFLDKISIKELLRLDLWLSYSSFLPEGRDVSRIDSHSANLILPFDTRKYHKTRYNTSPWPVKVPERDAYRDPVIHARANWVVAIPYVSTISSLLTLFSKFFSSFLRSTCSLSVSH